MNRDLLRMRFGTGIWNKSSVPSLSTNNRMGPKKHVEGKARRLGWSTGESTQGCTNGSPMEAKWQQDVLQGLLVDKDGIGGSENTRQ